MKLQNIHIKPSGWPEHPRSTPPAWDGPSRGRFVLMGSDIPLDRCFHAASTCLREIEASFLGGYYDQREHSELTFTECPDQAGLGKPPLPQVQILAPHSYSGSKVRVSKNEPVWGEECPFLLTFLFILSSAAAGLVTL